MKAVGYRTPSPIEAPDSLLDLTVADPEPTGRDLLVEVRAVSVNPVDIKVRASGKPAAAADDVQILGYDAAGVVRAVGPAVSMFQPGDEVFYAGAINRSGTNAELHLVDERIVAHKPATLGFAHAAALPLTSITAWELLFDRFGVTRVGSPLTPPALAAARLHAAPAAAVTASRQSLVILGGAGGVGSILIQLARQLTSLQIIATASRPETQQWCRALGAHHVVDHSQPLKPQLEALGIPAVELIASLTATDQHYPGIVELLAPQGKIGVIDDPKVLDAKPLKRKAASLHWEFMFARPVFQTPDMIAQHQLLTEVAALIDSGTLRTTLSSSLGTICAENLKRAHALIETGRAHGKIVLEGF